MENREKMKPLPSKSNPQIREEGKDHLTPSLASGLLFPFGPWTVSCPVGQEVVKVGPSPSRRSLVVTRAAFPLRKHSQGPVVQPAL